MQGRIAMVEALVGHLQTYLTVGLVLAVVFALFGVSRVDAAARFDRGAPIGSVLFRLLVLPAATLLWPLVLVRAIVILRAARASASPPEPGKTPGPEGAGA